MMNALASLKQSLLSGLTWKFKELKERQEINSILLAGIHIDRILKMERVRSLSEVEFKVFSQWGEDGIIQYLLSKVEIQNKVFVEFGVQNYTESNTRFLLVNNNWKGLVLDSSQDAIQFIRNDKISCLHDLSARCAMITRENINSILTEEGIQGDVGLLSVDIDGNDYWVWEAIDCIRPRIVICEYNSVFGKNGVVSIPYDPQFHRTRAHHSNLYFGASLSALCQLAERKGYDFVGSNSAGCNAFFVRTDLGDALTKFSAAEGYVESRARESRDEKGELTYLSGKARQKAIEHLPVYDFNQRQVRPLREIYAAD